LKITARNIIMHELIGLEVKVAESTHQGYLNIKGKIVDETMKTLKIMQDGKIKTVPKASCKFIFKLPDGENVLVDGRRILARPEDRVKRIPRRRW